MCLFQVIPIFLFSVTSANFSPVHVKAWRNQEKSYKSQNWNANSIWTFTGRCSLHWVLCLWKKAFAMSLLSIQSNILLESNYLKKIKKKKKKKKQLRKQNLSHITQSQVTFTCSKSTIETLEKTWNMLKVNYYCQVWTNFTPFSNCFYCSLWISKCQLGSLFAILKLFSPKSFLMFSGGTNKQHRAVMG